MKKHNKYYGYVTLTKIETENPQVLRTIIKDGELDLTEAPSKAAHTLKNFDNKMCQAEIETINGTFEDVIKKLHRLYPDAYIYIIQKRVLFGDDEDTVEWRSYHYKDGGFLSGCEHVFSKHSADYHSRLKELAEIIR